jgi:two-component sensor histidine kinase
MAEKRKSTRSNNRLARAVSERDALLRQQAALAEFGQLALRTDDLDGILQEGCRLVGEALGTNLSKVITLEGQDLFVRAGIGWRPGIVGTRRMRLEDDSADRYALDTGEPVIAVNPDEEKRFKIADFLVTEGVVAFVNVPIIRADSGHPFGILEVDSREPRHFTERDISFLRTYANMMAAAIERQCASRELHSLAQQRMQLLNELQHRLKNNLQSVAALVHLTMRNAPDPGVKDLLRSLVGRIDTLRLVHEKIYASGRFDRVELASYLGELGTALLRFHQTDRAEIGFMSDLRPLMVSPDNAIPLGLIVTEFITNSVKYAFDGGGTISLRLDQLDPEKARLVVSDNGKGLGQRNTAGTGMRLIADLARQVKAATQWKSETGTELTLIFPLREQT